MFPFFVALHEMIELSDRNRQKKRAMENNCYAEIKELLDPILARSNAEESVSHVAVESAKNTQVGGQHYKACKIQPFEYIHANGLGFAEGNVVKYVTRWKDKGGIEDLKKARHYLELLIEAEEKK